MAIKFRSTFNAKKRFDEITVKNKVKLGQALSDAKADMLIDIASGVGYDGKAMLKYSEGYKKYKISKGRTGRVDLTFTGKMLKSIQVSVIEGANILRGKIYFLAGERDKARWNLGLRKFFGLSEKSILKIKKTLGIK